MSDTESNKGRRNEYDYDIDYDNEYGNEYGNNENESQIDYQKYIDIQYNENLTKVLISEALINYTFEASIPLCEYLDPKMIDNFISEL